MAGVEELASWRQAIRSLDAEILQLIAKRMELAERIGQFKKDKQLPVKDFRVEKQIIERARESARQLGIYPNLAEEVMTSLINFSVLKQEELKREGMAPQDQAGKAVLVIGGAGRMGQWFAQFYESLGYAVSIFDPAPPSLEPSYPKLTSLEGDLDSFELIILATPMAITEQMLNTLAMTKPKGLVIEICSLKAPIMQGLINARDAGLRIASIHPMFGPETHLLAGKNIVFCDGSGLFSEELKQLHFVQTSARLISVPLDEHDRIMSYVLGAAHLMNLTYAQVLLRSGESLTRLREFAGTTFMRQLEVTQRVVSENQDLYFDIQTLNRSTPQLLATFQGVLEQLGDLISNDHRSEFRSIMSKAKHFFEEDASVR